MAGELQTNDRGDVIRFDGQSWVPADIAVNDKTGQRMAFDGKSWVDIPGPQKGAGGRILDKLTDTATYGPLGMAVKAADSVFGTDGGAALDNLKTGAIKGFSGAMALPREMIASTPMGVARAAQPGAQPSMTPWPEASDIQSAITQAPTAIGLPPVNMRTPTSSGGRLLQDVGQAIGSAPLPQMMGYNLAGGLGSWGAGELSEQNPWLKALGAVGGAGLYGGLQQTAPNAVSMIRRRLEQYQPAELNAGEALQREAQARGIQLMPQEVLDRSRADPMAQLAGTAAVQPQGRPIQQLAAGRVASGGSIPTAIEDAASTIGPRVTNPNEVARGLGAAGEAAVMEPQIARAAAANPLKAAAASDAVDPQVTSRLIGAIDRSLTEALPGGPVSAQLTRFRDLAANAKTVGQMDEALDAFRTIAKSQAFEGSPVPDSVRTVLKPLIARGYAGLELTSPNYLRFREVYKGPQPSPDPVTREMEATLRKVTGAAEPVYGPSPYSVAVEQAQASPAARIVKAQSDPASEGALSAFDNAILRNKLDPAVVKSEIARLNKQDPEAARDALRALIQRHADDAFKITKEGVPPTDSGVGFVKNTAGTDNTRAALLAAVEGVTGNQTTAKGFDRLLEIVQRTGVTPGIGSPTVTRGAIQNEAAQGGIANLALEGANITRGSWLGTLQDMNERFRASGAWGQIADLLVQPDSLAKIRQLALMNPASEKAKALAGTILQGVGHVPPAKGTPQ